MHLNHLLQWATVFAFAIPLATSTRASDPIENSPLHWACLNNDLKQATSLLDSGADVNQTNRVSATPLIYATGRLELVQLLVRHGAHVNHATQFKSTPLIVAARRPNSSKIVEYLLDQGADPTIKDGIGTSALDIAAQSGDLQTVELLLDRGLKPSNLIGPAMYGHKEIVTRFLAEGVPVNQGKRFAGHPLNHALYGQQADIALQLIVAGADLEQRSLVGQHETPPLLWAAYNEVGDHRIASTMIEHGVDVHQLSALGESALDWSRSRKNEKLERLLIDSGTKPGPQGIKDKVTPERDLPKSPDALRTITRASAAKAISLLQQASDAFLQSPLVQKQRCVSCHHQTLPALSFAWAKERGIPVNDESIARQVQSQLQFWNKNQKVAKSYELIRPQPDTPVVLGYGLLGFSELQQPSDTLTDAMIRYLLATQKPDGSWPAADFRPPMEDGPIQGTALAVACLKRYPITELAQEIQKQLRSARTYLEQAKPVTLNQPVFQLLGLHWAGMSPPELMSLSQALLRRQQSDGGWAPLNGLKSDAWATGQTLVALALAAELPVDSEVYLRGRHYLLRTQYEDGSWYVRSRSWPFQPHFETGFPHGKDQWISAGATAWASMALLLSLPTNEATPFPDWKTIAVSNAEKGIQESGQAPTLNPRTSFRRDIRPILNRSCGSCHGAKAKRKKGGFSIENRTALLDAGQSQQPVIISGRSQDSHIIRMITDLVEDLEMPPISKRPNIPALSNEEVTLLRAWIDEGLPE